jgi:putative FmdB family regulatory protein
MPLYEYQCDVCGRRFERIQKFSDPPADTCPACGGAVHKLASAPAFQLKGTGWYATDYAKKDSSKATGGSADKDVKTESGEQTAKPEKATSEKASTSGEGSSPGPAPSKTDSKTGG